MADHDACRKQTSVVPWRIVRARVCQCTKVRLVGANIGNYREKQTENFRSGEVVTCRNMMCLLLTLKRSFYPSTPSTPSVRADAELKAVLSQIYDTKYNTTCNAVRRVEHEIPCHRTGYGKHYIHTPATQIHRKRGKRKRNKVSCEENILVEKREQSMKGTKRNQRNKKHPGK